MAELPKEYEREALLLLTPAISDSTIKHRRNVSVLSFLVVLIYALEKSPTELKVLGLDLAGSNGLVVLAAGLAVLSFWLVMFTLGTLRDADVNRERKHLLEQQLEIVRRRIEQTKAPAEKGSEHFKGEHSRALQQYNIHERQLQRTKRARGLGKLATWLEYGLPFLLAAVAVVLLAGDIVREANSQSAPESAMQSRMSHSRANKSMEPTALHAAAHA